jgi:hypothetical protein
MALIEIEDHVLAAMAQHGISYKDASETVKQGREATAAWAKMLAGPDRLKLLEAYKAQFPDVAIPEIDAAKPITAEVEAVRKEFRDYKEAQEKAAEEARTKSREEAANSTVAKGRALLRGDKKLDDEGVTAVEKVMQDLGIPNYEVAFNHWKATQPPDPDPLPSAYGGARSLDWFKVEESRPDTKLLITDPKAFQRQETAKILQEIREGRLAAA